MSITEAGDGKKGDGVVSERKAKLVGRVISVGGGALILAVFAYLLATGSPLAGPFLALFSDSLHATGNN